MSDYVLFINAAREGYTPAQCAKSMTVGDLIDFLSSFNEEDPVYLRHDNGYTYGSIDFNDFELIPTEEVFNDEDE